MCNNGHLYFILLFCLYKFHCAKQTKLTFIIYNAKYFRFYLDILLSRNRSTFASTALIGPEKGVDGNYNGNTLHS